MTADDTDVRLMSPQSDAVTVGVDVGTTSVKALAVDGAGTVLARSRVPHGIFSPLPDQLEHDAAKAWRRGSQRAFADVRAQLDRPVAGVAVTSMVPSLTAVNGRGVPQLPGLLYGDARGLTAPVGEGAEELMDVGTAREAEGFLAWAAQQMPDAAGYWPCQAVAT